MAERQRLYLSGPMTGIADLNFPEFIRVANLLRQQNFYVFNPAEYWNLEDSDEFPLRKAMADYLSFICEDADGIVMLPGWENSTGALAEFHAAQAVQIKVYLWNGDDTLTPR